MSKKEEKNIAELGQRLLRGWTMLAESCPFACNVPLVEKKADRTIFCVSCERYFQRRKSDGGDDSGNFQIVPLQQQQQQPQQQQQQQQEQPQQQQQPAVAVPIAGQLQQQTPPASLPARAKLDNGSRSSPSSSDDVSSRIGERLLQGWTMLAESCPRCQSPLMRNRQQQMWCLGCQTQVITEQEFDPLRHRLAPSPGASPASSSSSSDFAPASAAAASVPLPVPQPQPRAAPLAATDTAPAASGVSGIGKSAAAGAAGGSGALSFPATEPLKRSLADTGLVGKESRAAATSMAESDDEALDAAFPPPSKRQGRASQHSTGSSFSVGGGQVASIHPTQQQPLHHHGKTLQDTIDTLYERIGQAQARLAAATDLELCRKLAGLIHDCAAALLPLQQLASGT